MEVFSSCLDARMSQCLLYQADRCAIVEGVARMSMSEPMRRNGLLNPCPFCGLAHQFCYTVRTNPKDKRFIRGFLAIGRKHLPDGWTEQD